MPARVAPVSLWTDTGAVRCVTKAKSALLVGLSGYRRSEAGLST